MILLTVTFPQDYERLRVQLYSIKKYVAGVSDHYVIILGSDQDVDLARCLFEPFGCTVLSCWQLGVWFENTAVNPREIANGWNAQQYYKLAFAEYVDYEDYLICDSKLIFVKPHSVDVWQGIGGPGIDHNPLEEWRITQCAYAGKLGLPVTATKTREWPFYIRSAPLRGFSRTLLRSTLYTRFVTPFEYSLYLLLAGDCTISEHHQVNEFLTGTTHRNMPSHPDTLAVAVKPDLFRDRDHAQQACDWLNQVGIPVELTPAEIRGVNTHSIRLVDNWQ